MTTPGGRPPLWAALGTAIGGPLFIGTVIVYVPFVMSGWGLGPPFFGWDASRWLGVALIVLAVPLFLDFLLRFVIEGHGTPVPAAPPQRLVVRGPFRFVRNPAYLTALMALVGQALLFGSTAILIYALAMAVVYHLLVVAHEEPALARKFGSEYDAYRRRVPRWIPRVPPRS